MTRNSAATGGGVSNPAGTSTTVRASIISGNTPDNCAPANSVPGCAR